MACLVRSAAGDDAPSMFAATSTADVVSDAVVIWLVATVAAGIAAFAMRLPAVGLALLGSVIGVPLGVLLGASMDWLELEEIPFGGAMGASAGLVLGGVIGLAGSTRVVPRPSPRALRWFAGSVVVAGITATWMGSRVLEACWSDANCHFPAVPVLVAADAAFLAVVLFAISVRPVDGAPARVDGEAAGGTWFLLAAFVAGGVVLWAIGATVSYPSFGLPIALAGTTFVSAFVLRKRRPAIALSLMMGISGAGAGTVASSMLGESWRTIMVGAAIGAIVGVAFGLVLQHRARSVSITS